MKKLIAIDGNSLMHRAFYALPPMTTRDGIPTGALHGFLSMLLKLVEQHPDYLVVAFDMHGPTFRHDDFPDYKAGRRETPDDLREQFPLIKKLLVDMGIPIFECERFEADDIIGTLARLANEDGVDALLVTGDRDALQLINDKTHVLMTKKGISDTIEYDEDVLKAQYGLSPERMVDLKGLMGDSSDNIPGIPGVGEKTALKLLEKYGTIEEVLSHAEDEKGAMREKLLTHAESARLSYQLGRIDRNAPIATTLDACAFVPGRLQGAVPALRALELRSIISRLPDAGGQGAQASEPEPAHDREEANIKITSKEELHRAALAARDASLMAFILNQNEFIFASDAGKQYEVRLSGTLIDPGLGADEVMAEFAPVFGAESPKKLVFDAKKIMRILDGWKIPLGGLAFDAMIADYLIHAIRPASSLESLCEERKVKSADARALIQFYHEMGQELASLGMRYLYDEIELPLIHVLFDMEKEGFSVDLAMLGELGAQFEARSAEISREIYAAAGEQFNILSTKQLGAVLFEKLHLPTQKKTKLGYSTDSEVLEKLMDAHPIVPLIMEYRFLTKLKSTFIDGLLRLTDAKTGRVHTTFNQNITVTGRISSTEPNLQNIPVRTKVGREIRKAFIASPGNMLVGADYSQIELRILAHMSGDKNMIRAFSDHMDIHTATASEAFGVPLPLVTSEQRSAAKAVNFGIVYGISDFGLARNLGISRKKAAEYIAMYFARYPEVKRYLTQSVEDGKRNGYVKTLMGRRRELPEIASSNFNTRSFGERVAMNMPIQGTAADIIKLAMVRVSKALREKGLKAKLVLQIHDELIVDTPKDEIEAVSALVKACMEDVMELSAPLSVDVRVGKSWFDTK